MSLSETAGDGPAKLRTLFTFYLAIPTLIAPISSAPPQYHGAVNPISLWVPSHRGEYSIPKHLVDGIGVIPFPTDPEN